MAGAYTFLVAVALLKTTVKQHSLFPAHYQKNHVKKAFVQGPQKEA
jgi:hypothetical protein